MKLQLTCLLLGAMTQLVAQRHSHHDRKEKAEKKAQRVVEDLQDYVPNMTVNSRDSISHYFTDYLGNAMTYSPTRKVRKKSRANLDTRVKKVLSQPQFEEYGVFMKDLEKRHAKKSHFHHRMHHFAFRGHGPKEGPSKE